MSLKRKVERIEKELGSINDALEVLENENGKEIGTEEVDGDPTFFEAQPAIRVLKDHAYKLRRKL